MTRLMRCSWPPLGWSYDATIQPTNQPATERVFYAREG